MYALGQGHPGDDGRAGLVRGGQDLLQRLVPEHVDNELDACAAGVVDRLERLPAGLRAHPVGADPALVDQVVEQLPDARSLDDLAGRAVQLNEVDRLDAEVAPGPVVPGAEAVAAVGVRLVDTPGFPEEYKPEAQAFSEVLDLYRKAGSALTWTLLSPAPAFTDKPRTGTYTEGTDQPAGSEISVADFAVALVDEAERDGHRNRRWTIANA